MRYGHKRKYREYIKPLQPEITDLGHRYFSAMWDYYWGTSHSSFNPCFMMNNSKYSFKKTLEKVGISLLEILVAGFLVWVTDFPYLLFLVPIVEGFRNWLKNKNKK
jgi:hypothetical protein